MGKIIASLLIWAVLCGESFARFGETPEQCIERYGAAVTNLPGHGDVERVAIHTKDDLSITIVFFRGSDNKSTAGLILYSKAKPFSPGFSSVSDIAPENEAVILSTVKGQWTQDKPAKGLEGAKPFGGNIYSSGRIVPSSTLLKNTPISTGPGITAERSDKVAKAVQDFLPILYPNEASYTPSPISRNGSRIFSYRVLHGVVICSADIISGITLWADHARVRNVTPAPKTITGL